MKALSQYLHGYGLSPAWERTCRVNFDTVENPERWKEYMYYNTSYHVFIQDHTYLTYAFSKYRSEIELKWAQVIKHLAIIIVWTFILQKGTSKRELMIIYNANFDKRVLHLIAHVHSLAFKINVERNDELCVFHFDSRSGQYSQENSRRFLCTTAKWRSSVQLRRNLWSSKELIMTLHWI